MSMEFSLEVLPENFLPVSTETPLRLLPEHVLEILLRILQGVSPGIPPRISSWIPS